MSSDSASKAHDCLRVDEVFASICREASGGTILTATTHATLLSLASACTSFKEIALDELWRTQTSLIPLVRCFPADSWKYNDSYGRTLRFTRSLLLADWSIPLSYAKRIQVLAHKNQNCFLSDGLTEFATHQVWQMLWLSRPPELHFLLPSLRVLQWFQSPACFQHLRKVLSPSLNHLYLDIPVEGIDDIAQHSVLLALQDLCPALKHCAVGYAPSRANKMMKAFQQWSSLSLQQLTINSYVDEYILGSIGSILTLASFSFIYDHTKKISTWPRQKFPALQELWVNGCNIDALAALLASISSPGLREIQATNSLVNSTTSYKSLCYELKAFRTLETLVISENEKIPGCFSEVRRVTTDDLTLLGKSAVLARIHITTMGIFELGDDLFRTAEWPDLTSLRLRSLPSGDIRVCRPSDGVTLHGGLVSLINRSPKLKDLELYIDATVFDCSLDTRPGNGVHNKEIKSLMVGSSPVSNTVKVAAFLVAVLPNLTSIQGNSLAWKEVMQHFQTFKAVLGWSRLD